MKELELYIHIPFCVRKCSYCDFLSFPASEEMKEKYVTALASEIRKAGEEYKDRKITSVYMGGGTPSLLSVSQIMKIGEALDFAFELKGVKLSFKNRLKIKSRILPEIEFSVECNPKTVTSEKLRAFKKIGVNRLSIGLQSSNAAELKALGRIHSFEDFLESYELARKAGFNNINVDLMEAVPGQDLKSFRKTLAEVIALKPEHISAYSLILEEGTPLYEKTERGEELNLPGEDEEREIYYAAGAMLKASGYDRYEISNYALPGYECIHNLGYWQRKDYLGLGLGASSLADNVRWKNTSDMDKYMKGLDLKEEIHELSRNEQMEEFMFLGLRQSAGISKAEFFENFGADYDMIYGEVSRKMGDQGLLKSDGERVYLTDRGVDVSNAVFSEFLLQI